LDTAVLPAAAATVAHSFKKVQTMIVAVVAGTLFLRGTIETNTIQSGTLYLGLIFLSIVSSLPWPPEPYYAQVHMCMPQHNQQY
jgi:hypothetical protein